MNDSARKTGDIYHITSIGIVVEGCDGEKRINLIQPREKESRQELSTNDVGRN